MQTETCNQNVNFKNFQTDVLSFLTHLRAQIACYELEGDLSAVMLKEIFHDRFEKFKIFKGLYGNNASVTGW